ncbi:hypothetical protein [uncultured Kriegella sp.]|uniref:hypothetical protein n=1 Tax=uncultured Kriegella sp. TaxID=1798910 RepID=UPI0030DAE1D6|tara:strand:- start:4200 stop:4643 length:444 start_codon:yes stop_codon:yes gene_type:complete
MQDQILRECLLQLIKVYAFAEQQCIYTSIQAQIPILKIFFEQRAFERMSLMEEIEQLLFTKKEVGPVPKTLEQLYHFHSQIYGKNALTNIHIANIDSIIIDEKALEICNCLLAGDLNENVSAILKSHSITLESSILSIVYLKALYED